MKGIRLLEWWLVVAASATPALRADDPGPKHLHAASEPVRPLDLTNTRYQHGKPDVHFAAPYRSHADCSGFLDALLQHTYGYTPEQFKKWFGQERPTADHYHDVVTRQEIFEQIKDFRHVHAGDILAVKYKIPR